MSGGTSSTSKRMGGYEIIRELGRGGMGVVHLARDTKLEREVAIKVLPDMFSRDPDRLARFEREAKLLASLSHPNIAAIHGLEEDGGTRYLVLELAAGETLKERIRRGPLPIEDVLPVARQIAAALEAAHAKGIVHRDLKPSNIKVTPDDRVKVLDFGLAKALLADTSSSVSANSPTITAASTREGVVLGTAAYMSPEQARGKPVDKRTDIWAFGCVLYEMLSGKQAFGGETTTDIMAGVLRGEPDWGALPDNTPGTVQLLLRRCLQKDASRRLHDIADARIELEDSATGSSISFSSLPLTATEHKAARRGLGLIGTLLGVAVGIVAGGAAIWKLRPAPAPPPKNVSRLSMVIPKDLELHGYGITPDGSRILFSATEKEGSPRERVARLYSRALGEFEPQVIAGTDRVRSWAISPDGRWIVFAAANEATGPGGKIKKVAMDGGPSVTLHEYVENLPFVQWPFEDTLLLAPFQPPILMRMAASGGEPIEIARLDASSELHWFGPPSPLPGGRFVLATIMGVGEKGFRSRTELVSMDGNENQERRVLLADGFGARYVPSGHLVFSREDAIFKVPFDLETLQVTGEVVPAMSGLSTSGEFASWFAFSTTGTLVFRAGDTTSETGKLVRIDHEGVVEPITSAERKFEGGDVSLSPDGRRIALTILDDRKLPVLWTYDYRRDTLTPFAKEGLAVFSPLWSPDGEWVIFSAYEVGKGGGIYRKRAGGSTAPELLYQTDSDEAAEIFLGPTSFAPDASVVLLNLARMGSREINIWMLTMNEPYTVKPLIAGPAREAEAKFSPDGKWLAYQSDESAQWEVYLTDYPGMNRRWRVSTSGGENPFWSPDGKMIYLEDNDDRLVAVTVETEPAVSLSTPKVLFDYDELGLSSRFEITPDGQYFITTQFEKSESEFTELRVVLNWFEELRERVPVASN